MAFDPASFVSSQATGGITPPENRSTSAQEKIDNSSNSYVDNSQKVGQVVQMNPMKFPIEHADRHSGSMTFQAVKIIPPSLSISSDTLQKVKTKLQVRDSESVTQKELSEDPNSTENSAIESKGQEKLNDEAGQDALNSMKIEILDGHKVSMFIPTSFVVNDIISYENTELGISGAAGLQALQNTGNILGAAQTAIKTGISGVKDMFSAGSSLTGIAARVALARGINAVPLPGFAKDAIRSAAQVTVNPNVRSIFRGVALREFTFQFKLIPTSQKESEEIKRIIKFFRYHAYPESIQVGGVPLIYNFPSMFKIKLKYKNNTVGSRIKMCYLRNISTSYNPTTSSFFADGNPTEIDLSLSFVENTTLVRQDIDDGKGTNPAEEGSANLLDAGSGF